MTAIAETHIGSDLDQLCINTIRTLSMDAVQQAKSGHPGTPMALAPLVYTIWNRVMRFDPQDPIWPNRDRFVLSNGHACMLLMACSLLHRPLPIPARRSCRGVAGSARPCRTEPPGTPPEDPTPGTARRSGLPCR